jgi:hypothetical protein
MFTAEIFGTSAVEKREFLFLIFTLLATVHGLAKSRKIKDGTFFNLGEF